MKMLILALLMIITGSLYCQQETITDTLYVIPELDGIVGYRVLYNSYHTDIMGYDISVGAYYGNISFSETFNRGFLAYPLPDIPENYHLSKATMYIFQYWSTGNDAMDVYPIFNMPYGDIEPPCLIEHIDYGSSLNTEDFHLPALHPADTLSTTPEQGWRSLEITGWVMDDMANNRPYTQSRLRLSLDTDLDGRTDMLGFSSGNHPVYTPYIVYEYSENSGIELENEMEEQTLGLYINAFPNPLSNEGKIFLSSRYAGLFKLSLFNVKGQLIQTVFSGNIERGNKEILVDTTQLSNGIYFIKATVNNQVAVRKILIQK